MDEWTPILALPNLDMKDILECAYAAIVSATESRVMKLCATHPKLKTSAQVFYPDPWKRSAVADELFSSDIPDHQLIALDCGIPHTLN